ncbi:MAG TPA: lipid II flippase MurJ [Planctomycetota bacterium]|nr:lipid II flippase MurJ [Planctomycetota bacterium]
MYRKLLKNCSTISVGLILGRLSGMIKLAIVASFFGTGDGMDAFLVAMVIPAGIVTVCGEALYVSTIRLTSRRPAGGRQQGEWYEVSSLFNYSVLAMAAIAAAYWFCAPAIVRLVAPGFSGDKFHQACLLAQCLAPLMILGVVQHILHGILHSSDRFVMSSLQMFFANMLVVVLVWLLARDQGIAAYALGSVASELFCCLVCYLAARRAGARYVPAWSPRSGGVRESVRFGLPVMAGVAMLQVTFVTDRIFSSKLPAGSISALGYGLLLLAVPLSLVRSVVDAGFPSISGLFSQPRSEAADRKLQQSMFACFKMLMVIGMPLTVLLVLWRNPLIGLLLKRGEFDAASAAATAVALFFYAFGLMPLVARHFLTRLSQSAGDSLTPLPSSLICTVFNISLNILLVPVLGHAAIALSLSLAVTLGVGILFVQLRRKVRALQHCGIEAECLRGLCAGALMVGGYLLVEQITGSFAAAGGASMVFYAAGLVAFGVVEIRHLLGWRRLLHAPSAAR